MASLAQIYDWFMTGKKPTQAQFWASWGSFWNKGESIPQSAISNLTASLNAKAEKSQIDGHFTDVNAHALEFSAKEDKSQKGSANGYVPLDEFTKIARQYLTIIDDLVTGGSDALSAEQGKLLQGQIDGINTLLASDDINLDTVQELVDAIKTVETSLETILVNDLTTGGTTKALTAEMGKSLKALIDAIPTPTSSSSYSIIRQPNGNNGFYASGGNPSLTNALFDVFLDRGQAFRIQGAPNSYGTGLLMQLDLTSSVRPILLTNISGVDFFEVTRYGRVIALSDIEITDLTKGYILKSPDASRWRITIDNNGALNTTKL